ncbi:hypothetical protein [Simkania negevensis]|uniref:Uncharacterized protein n=1 Tax=Simkania negevensis (strain ATCC VR-1471 / DSM 27360 / Z) TaxID=331113 RepID=F8L6V7_SIMNZ|nr:hypothetical protein [Simkania negevensis]CCB88459.1 hypothetical protein SNE_A05820 [Simkania negevensis Z]
MTSEMLLLLKGLITGFFYTFISINAMLLIAYYVVKEDTKSGIVGALGVIVVQAIWASIAVLLLHFSYHGFGKDPKIYALIGSIILFIMAIKVYRSRGRYGKEPRLRTRPIAIFSSTFFLALAIPMRIFGYGAILLALDIHPSAPKLAESIFPIVGILLGTSLFWWIFIFAAHHSKKIIPLKTLQHFHQFAAFLLVAFSIVGLLQIYFS